MTHLIPISTLVASTPEKDFLLPVTSLLVLENNRALQSILKGPEVLRQGGISMPITQMGKWAS